MGKPRKTNDKFVRELHNIKPDLKPLEHYPQNNHTKINIQCLCCGHIWSATPQALLQKTKNGYNGCPVCSKKLRAKNITKTHEQFVKELKEITQDIIPLETYIDNRTKILCKCLVCNYEWRISPEKLLSGRRCPECNKKKTHQERAYTRDEFITKLYQVNPNIVLLGDYYNARTKTKFQCCSCGFIWDAMPFPLLKGVGCPRCNNSKGELRITKYCCDHNIEAYSYHSFDDCRYKRPLKFDFYLPKYNLCIEYDGIQHFKPVDIFGGVSEFIKTKQRDAIKDKYCKDHNIKLLRIPYTEYEHIEEIMDKTIMYM